MIKDDHSLSVVIPVFNAEEHILKCLKSIIRSKNNDLEVIIVDNGSTDSTREIIDNFIIHSQLDFIHLYTISQKGAALARNFGINLASKKYIIFVDADDEVDMNIVDSSLRRFGAKKPDVIIARAFFIDYKLNSKITNIPVDTLTRLFPLFYKFNKPKFTYYGLIAPWNKIYSRSFLLEQNLLFQDLSTANDVAFFFTSLACTRQIFYQHTPFYSYFTEVDNSISTKALDNWQNLFISREFALKSLCDRRVENNFKIELINRSILDFIYWSKIMVANNDYQKYLIKFDKYLINISKNYEIEKIKSYKEARILLDKTYS